MTTFARVVVRTTQSVKAEPVSMVSAKAQAAKTMMTVKMEQPAQTVVVFPAKQTNSATQGLFVWVGPVNKATATALTAPVLTAKCVKTTNVRLVRTI